jgi:YD repeat-containing protein
VIGMARNTHAAGNLIEKLDSEGKTLLKFTIGRGNQTTGCQLSSGGFRKFEYDKNGRLITGKTESHSTKFAYDEFANRIEDKRDNLGVELIVERNYIDRDFLEDFASFYVKCFDDYSRKCTRLHFFASVFSETDFNQLLEDGRGIGEADLAQSYLGFLVIKPLPTRAVAIRDMQ